MKRKVQALWDRYMRLSDISDAAYRAHTEASKRLPTGFDRETWDTYKAAWDKAHAAWKAYYAAYTAELQRREVPA